MQDWYKVFEIQKAVYEAQINISRTQKTEPHLAVTTILFRKKLGVV